MAQTSSRKFLIRRHFVYSPTNVLVNCKMRDIFEVVSEKFSDKNAHEILLKNPLSNIYLDFRHE